MKYSFVLPLSALIALCLLSFLVTYPNRNSNPVSGSHSKVCVWSPPAALASLPKRESQKPHTHTPTTSNFITGVQKRRCMAPTNNQEVAFVHTPTRPRAHAPTRARARARAHTHTYTHTHSGLSQVELGLGLSPRTRQVERVQAC